jgi:Protein of unknown function (DUF2721)
VKLCRSSGSDLGHTRAVNDNPFTVLTAIVAPAILTNACSVLALGTSNRVARVVDRSRVLAAELAKLRDGDPGQAARLRQLERLRLRSRMLMSALRIIYAALGSFAACALISVLGALATSYGIPLLFHVSALVALAVGLGGVLAVVAGCSRMVAETHLALLGMTEEVSDTLAERPL